MADVKPVAALTTKIFADGADIAGMRELYALPFVKGFTTNPTLMRKSGIVDYHQFAQEVCAAIPDRPLSFEVFADTPVEMERQARAIATWGEHIYVKIPITNTQGVSMVPLVRTLTHEGIKVNVTALMTFAQVHEVATAIEGGGPCCVSVFAGRIADTGRDPMPLMKDAVEALRANPLAELIWASPRELLNIYQADAIGCHIITATRDILQKLTLVGKDLDEYSLETVRMFHRDALDAKFAL